MFLANNQSSTDRTGSKLLRDYKVTAKCNMRRGEGTRPTVEMSFPPNAGPDSTSPLIVFWFGSNGPQHERLLKVGFKFCPRNGFLILISVVCCCSKSYPLTSLILVRAKAFYGSMLYSVKQTNKKTNPYQNLQRRSVSKKITTEFSTGNL